MTGSLPVGKAETRRAETSPSHPVPSDALFEKRSAPIVKQRGPEASRSILAPNVLPGVRNLEL
jgi:hypothetical protein